MNQYIKYGSAILTYAALENREFYEWRTCWHKIATLPVNTLYQQEMSNDETHHVERVFGNLLTSRLQDAMVFIELSRRQHERSKYYHFKRRAHA
jgi:hypothetical protein